MIPYFPEPVWQVGPARIHAVNLLVALGAAAGGAVVLSRGRRAGISREEMFRFCFAIYAGGIAGAFLVWNPLLVSRPAGWSFGGFLGALAGAICYCRLAGWDRRESLRRMDLAVYGAPVGVMLGRLGCTLAHHHRGAPAEGWLGVQFPEGPRYDLGFLEFLFLGALSLGFAVLGRREHRPGFFLALFPIAYGGYRIFQDTLRNDEGVRYAPGAVMILFGVAVAGMAREHARGAAQHS